MFMKKHNPHLLKLQVRQLGRVQVLGDGLATGYRSQHCVHHVEDAVITQDVGLHYTGAIDGRYLGVGGLQGLVIGW